MTSALGAALAWRVKKPGEATAQMATCGLLVGVRITWLLPLHAVLLTVFAVVPWVRVTVSTAAPSTRMRPTQPMAQPLVAVRYRP